MTDKAGSKHFLVQIDRLINWVPLASLMHPVGSPAHTGLSPVVVKMLLLARWYGMSEDALLEACQDRMSFRRFLGLPLTDSSGDEALGTAFRRQTAQAPMESQKLIHAVEAQLLDKGFSIRPGMWAEAFVLPIPFQSAANKSSFSETTVFQLGEIEELIGRDQSLPVRNGAILVVENLSDHTDPVVQQRSAKHDAAPLKASLEWPWGAITGLGDCLIVGRDHRFCPYAAELAAYPHVSRKHAELTSCPVGIWVRDLRSQNGTFVDDERLPKGNAYLVESDAQLRFGPYCIVQVRLES